MKGRVVYFGTPDESVASLQALLEAGYDLAAVVTQPDRPAGRGRRLTPPPVKKAAQAQGLTVIQPKTCRHGEITGRIKELSPDFIVTVACGFILPADILALARLAPVNLHFSLLPALRGAAPVAWALINSQEETGVTTIEMVPDLDAGPVFLQRQVSIDPQETAGELTERLAGLGAGLLVKTLEGLTEGRIQPQPQDETAATWAPALKAAEGRLDLTQPARRVRDRVRGVTPWPGASVGYAGKRLKVFDCAFNQNEAGAEPGRVVALGPAGFKVACGQGHLYIGRVQHPGKRPVASAEAARGAGPRVGERLE